MTPATFRSEIYGQPAVEFPVLIVEFDHESAWGPVYLCQHTSCPGAGLRFRAFASELLLNP